MEEKLELLRSLIRDCKRAAVAFSAGVDSTFLLKVASEVLGDDCLALTAVSPAFPKEETEEAVRFCSDNRIRQITFEAGELGLREYSENPVNRCYYCKRQIFKRMLELASENGICVVMEGSNIDDLSDYRPGLSALKELKIKSPLREAGLTKTEIRELSKGMGLKTWDKQSFACLASRIPYGEEITAEKLLRIGSCERVLSEAGFKNYRVRAHGTLARIEVLPEELERLVKPDIREDIVRRLKENGFTYVTMDLSGYRTGSLNEAVRRKGSLP
ncbi:MAG TPA: ATP-dependent sacrificial sulfur transferase LarE [Lachnospiraceae bacterium]|nr:ATP-dependent sacrificial sulfur transferase LarE [Lachnospiraceae bacterium]